MPPRSARRRRRRSPPSSATTPNPRRRSRTRKWPSCSTRWTARPRSSARSKAWRSGIERAAWPTRPRSPGWSSTDGVRSSSWLAEFAMEDTLAMMREEVRDHTLVRRDVERITADRARRWGLEGRERARPARGRPSRAYPRRPPVMQGEATARSRREQPARAEASHDATKPWLAVDNVGKAGPGRRRRLNGGPPEFPCKGLLAHCLFEAESACRPHLTTAARDEPLGLSVRGVTGSCGPRHTGRGTSRG